MWSLIKYYQEFKIVFILFFSLKMPWSNLDKGLFVCVSSPPPLQKTQNNAKNQRKNNKKL